MTEKSFLKIDGEFLPIEQILGYLQSAGQLQNFIIQIVREYLLEQLLKEEESTESSALIEQAIINFRLQNNLGEPKLFSKWLEENNLSYDRFHQQVSAGVKLAQLKVKVAQPELEGYFIEKKLFLDRVVLSRIVLETQELAEELHLQIMEGNSFEVLAKNHSIAEDRVVNGMMGPVSRGTLPDILRAKVDQAKVGDIIGPLNLEESWFLFRVEQILPASLEDEELKETLQNEIFDRWLNEKIQELEVKIDLS